MPGFGAGDVTLVDMTGSEGWGVVRPEKTWYDAGSNSITSLRMEIPAEGKDGVLVSSRAMV
jgi:hypothetical protein